MSIWPFRARGKKQSIDASLAHEKKMKIKKLKELSEAFKDAAGASKKFVSESKAIVR